MADIKNFKNQINCLYLQNSLKMLKIIIVNTK